MSVYVLHSIMSRLGPTPRSMRAIGLHTLCCLPQVCDIFQRTQAAFPEAEVVASTLDEFTLALQAALPDLKLPVVTEEIGDTWAYGIASDADKVAEFRALLRMRTATEWKVQEAAYRNFSRLLLKVAKFCTSTASSEWSSVLPSIHVLTHSVKMHAG